MENSQPTIRAASPEDAEQLHQLHTHPSVYPHLLQLPYSTVDAWKKRLQDIEKRHTLVAERPGEILGAISLKLYDIQRIKHRGYLGMAIKHTHQGQGIGSALMTAIIDLADQWLNLKRLELTVFTDNEAAIALYKKYNFKIEGELQAYAFRNGEFVNAYSMSRIQ